MANICIDCLAAALWSSGLMVYSCLRKTSHLLLTRSSPTSTTGCLQVQQETIDVSYLMGNHTMAAQQPRGIYPASSIAAAFAWRQSYHATRTPLACTRRILFAPFICLLRRLQRWGWIYRDLYHLSPVVPFHLFSQASLEPATQWNGFQPQYITFLKYRYTAVLI